MSIIFTIYVVTAAWQDLKKRSISMWLFLLFGAVGVAALLRGGGADWLRALLALLPGCLLLLFTKCSGGAVGSGDGWFFIVTAFYLDVWSVTALLFYGLICCSVYCLCLIVWGCFSKISVKKRRLPFLPFLLPAWFWMGLLR